MKRHQIILAAVLAVQVALAAIIYWPRTTADGAPAKLFGDLTADQVTRLMIEAQGDERIVLSREMGAWSLPEADGYPARDETVTEFVEKLVDLGSDRLVTETAASHERLQVTDDTYQRRITIGATDGLERVVLLGSSPAYGATHVRLEGEDEVYMTSDLSAWEANTAASGWVESGYLQLATADLQQVTVSNAQGTVTVVQSAPDEWSLVGMAEGEVVDTYAVASYGQRVASISLLEPLGKTEDPGYGLSDPSATISITLADRTVTLRVGAKDPLDNSYVIKSSESPYYVRVSEYVVKEYVEGSRETLLQQPEVTE